MMNNLNSIMFTNSKRKASSANSCLITHKADREQHPFGVLFNLSLLSFLLALFWALITPEGNIWLLSCELLHYFHQKKSPPLSVCHLQLVYSQFRAFCWNWTKTKLLLWALTLKRLIGLRETVRCQFSNYATTLSYGWRRPYILTSWHWLRIKLFHTVGCCQDL